MYLSESAFSWAIQQLRSRSHPFVGITFLACKAFDLPVGRAKGVSLDQLTRTHLDRHHKLDSGSAFYFQPFKSSKWWLNPKYPSSGLQAMNTQTFGEVFIHQKGTREWGFRTDYVSRIAAKISTLYGHGPTPLLPLAIWMGKYKDWPSNAQVYTIVRDFVQTHHLDEEELHVLFEFDQSISPQHLFDNGTSIPNVTFPVTTADGADASPFDDSELDLRKIAHQQTPPPDAPEVSHGTLSSIQLSNIGPAPNLDLHFGNRLTLIAGDNGLGKSFLLNITWHVLSQTLHRNPVAPDIATQAPTPSIRYQMSVGGSGTKSGQVQFDRQHHRWRSVKSNTPAIDALLIYSVVDGSVRVSDPARASWHATSESRLAVFSEGEVWDGLPGQIEGIVRDWLTWQTSDSEEHPSPEFGTLTSILRHLSSQDVGDLTPSEPVRILGDPRRIPTIQFPYGDVPIVYVSAGVKRILSLAYVITWAWHEHKMASKQLGQQPVSEVVVLVDEVEMHLHPRWQRMILPALMTVGRLLSEELSLQMVVATHSPLVLASIETYFSSCSDVLYHLDLVRGQVSLKPMEYRKFGDTSKWLTSPVFGLGYARSREAEAAIEEAKRVQNDCHPSSEEVIRISDRLRECLTEDDSFWPRWTYFAKRAIGGDL